MKVLFFRLEGAMQSWGERSRWDHRDTQLMPTKSGIVGLLGCCAGYPRGDARLAALSRAIRVAVRADRAGRMMEDFQTVQGTGGVLLAAHGKKKTGGNTIVSPRQYLQNAAFQVFIEGEEEVLRTCARAMRAPCWPTFLGRKSCPPSVPLVPSMLEYASLEDAVRRHPVSARDRDATDKQEILAEIEYAAEDGETLELRTRSDEVIDASRELYHKRRVRTIVVNVGEVSACS